MHRALVVLSVLGVGLGLTACGKPAKPNAFSVTTAEPGPGKVAIAAPSKVKAGLVKLTLRNTGPQPHDAAFVRIDGTHSAQELVDVLASSDAPIPDWAHLAGGVSAAKPGETKTAEVNLPPGSYYLVDPGSDDNNNSFAKAGAIQPLEVTGKASTASLPNSTGTVTIVASDYSFAVSDSLKAGTTTIKFQNKGRQPHHLVAAPLMPGKTLLDVNTALRSKDQSGPPPVDFAKGTELQAIDGGASEVTTMTFEKGTYVFTCFLEDRGGGPPHFTLGMLQEVRIS